MGRTSQFGRFAQPEETYSFYENLEGLRTKSMPAIAEHLGARRTEIQNTP